MCLKSIKRFRFGIMFSHRKWKKKSFQTEKGKKTHNVTNDNIIEVLFFLLLLSKRKLKLFFFNHSLFDFDLRKFQNK
jgi:hypothetical protein